VALAHWSHPRAAVTVLGGLIVGGAGVLVADVAESLAAGAGLLEHVPAVIALLVAGAGVVGAPLVVALRGKRRVWLSVPALLSLIILSGAGIRAIHHHSQSVAQARVEATAGNVTRILRSQGVAEPPLAAPANRSSWTQQWNAAWSAAFQKAGPALAQAGVRVVHLHPLLIGISADLTVKGSPYCYHAIAYTTVPDGGTGWATPGTCADPDYSAGG